MYEHKIFTQGIDLEHQQLRPVGRRARQAARDSKILPELEDPAQVTTHDASTNGLINRYKSPRQRRADRAVGARRQTASTSFVLSRRDGISPFRRFCQSLQSDDVLALGCKLHVALEEHDALADVGLGFLACRREERAEVRVVDGERVDLLLGAVLRERHLEVADRLDVSLREIVGGCAIKRLGADIAVLDALVAAAIASSWSRCSMCFFANDMP